MFDLLSRLPVVGFRPVQDHERLCALQAESEALLEDASAAPFEAAPAVSGWTPAQHLFHAASIDRSVFAWLRGQCDDAEATARASAADSSAEGGPNVTGQLLLLFGRFPRGRAQAPERFVPPAPVGREALAELLAENRTALHALWRCLPRIDALEGRRKHPVMGRLNPREWLRFARIHTGHHQRIVREIIAAP